MKKKYMKAEEFDKKFDDGEDVIKDTRLMLRSNSEQTMGLGMYSMLELGGL